MTSYACNGKGVQSLEYINDTMLASGCQSNGQIKLWNFNDGTLIKTLSSHTDTINAMQYRLNSSILASGSRDNKIKIWDMKSLTLKSTIAETSDIKCLAFITNDLIACGVAGSNYVSVWNVTTGVKVKQLNHGDKVQALLLLQNGILLSGDINSNFGTSFWNVSAWTLISSFKPERSVLMFASKQAIINPNLVGEIKGGNNLCIYDTSQNVRTLLGLSKYDSLEFLDNDWIAAANQNYDIEIWDIYTKSKISTISNAHSSKINSLKLLSDQSYITTNTTFKTEPSTSSNINIKTN
jgi:WD40 repeat protein